MSFPKIRLRRLRQTPLLRKMVRETAVLPENLIYPLFVRTGRGIRRPISSMPGQFQISIDEALKEVKECRSLGIAGVLLFGIPGKKDPRGSDAYSDQGIVQKATRAIKDKFPDAIVATDLCFCEYTDHGHCGIIRKKGKSGFVLDNDATLEIIAQAAIAQARAGSDIIAPSGMMDGMVKTIRTALDKNDFQDKIILAYSAKYASAFYGPFREAAESPPQFGDRKTYQMDIANAREALREVQEDILEGADIVMVKPALPYLDVIRRIRDRFNVPVAAYNVSGEYAMVKAAGLKGWVDEKKIVSEVLSSIKRAGADLILTYHAKEFAKAAGK